jgi:uncharacterized protein DUF4062
VIAMEDYVATDQRPTEKCLADVATSDLYIGIFAWRYGYIPLEMNPKHKSITELEYRKAIQTGKSCLFFLLDEEISWTRKAMDEVTGEGNRGEYIEALRRELTQEKIVSCFRTPEELASPISTAVSDSGGLKNDVQRQQAQPPLRSPSSKSTHSKGASARRRKGSKKNKRCD